VPSFLSPSWLEQLTALAGGDGVGPSPTVVQQLVTGGPDGDIAFVLEVDQGKVRATPGRNPDAVVTLIESWETAVRLHHGQVTAREAFMNGLIRVRGDVRKIVDAAAGLASLAPALAALRDDTAGA
jgi:putative sterol carrier protein